MLIFLVLRSLAWVNKVSATDAPLIHFSENRAHSVAFDCVHVDHGLDMYGEPDDEAGRPSYKLC
jgi:hypothetical protein